MKITILKKLLAILIVLTIIPLVFLGYIAINDAKGLGFDAADQSSTALKNEAVTNMVRLASDSADAVNDVFVEVELDLEGFSKNVHMVYKSSTLYPIEYTGDTFAYWASSDWPDHTDKTRLTGILAGSIQDDNYDFVMSLFNETQQATFTKILETLNGVYETVKLPAEAANRFFPRFLVTYPEEGTPAKKLFFDLDALGDIVQKSSQPFALNDFMYTLLDSTAQQKLDRMLNMLTYGISTVDTHVSYNNLRFGFWDGTTSGVEAIYVRSGGKPLHPAAYGIGNCYYCKSPYALRDAAGTLTVWLTQTIDPTSKVSTATFPIYDTWGDQTTELIGFSEYWISWQTLSENIINTKYAQTGYMIMIDNTGKIVAHPESDKLGTQFGEENNTELTTVIEQMKSGESDYAEVTIGGEDVYLTYASIPTTGWSVGLIVPIAEIIQSAEDIRGDIQERTESLGTQNTVLMVTIVTILIVLIVGFIFARSITNPVKKLKEVADKVTDGDFNARLPPAKGTDEVAELTASMEMVVTALKMKSKKE